MTRAKIRVVLLALGLLGACHRQAGGSEATGERVNPRAFDAFYLWPGVRPPEGIKPKVLYLLDGEIRRAGAPVFFSLRPGSPHLPAVALWLVVRVERLDWNEETYRTIFADLARWQAAGNQIIGLQVDFDARTRGIGGYAQFLAGLRKRLPPEFQLSITGLMDWSANGDPRALATLHSVIDEVVVQTYQARDTIPGYDAYFARMTRFPIPFRVALVQGGVWTPPPSLAHQPIFRGYVVFMIQKPAARPTVKTIRAVFDQSGSYPHELK